MKMFIIRRVAKPQYVALLLSVLTIVSFTYLTPNPTYTSAAFTNSATATTNISALDTIYKWSGTTNNSASTAGYSNGAVRTNLSLNPSIETNITNWVQYSAGGSATPSKVSTGGTTGSSFARLTWVTAPPSFSGGIYYNLPSVTAGTTYSASLDVRPNTNQSVRMGFEWYNGSGQFSTTYATALLISGATWTRLSYTATAPATSLYVHITVYQTSGAGGHNWLVGDYLDADSLIIEAAATGGTYFDGSS